MYLEKVFYEMWNDKHNSAMFRQPVDPLWLPDYAKIITNPISLTDIRNKLESHVYLTKRQFTDDINLMLDNCKKYNGAQSSLTNQCRELLHTAEDAMRRDPVAKKLREFEDLAGLQRFI